MSFHSRILFLNTIDNIFTLYLMMNEVRIKVGYQLLRRIRRCTTAIYGEGGWGVRHQQFVAGVHEEVNGSNAITTCSVFEDDV